jgi:hypothetical protein
MLDTSKYENHFSEVFGEGEEKDLTQSPRSQENRNPRGSGMALGMLRIGWAILGGALLVMAARAQSRPNADVTRFTSAPRTRSRCTSNSLFIAHLV